MRVKSNMKKENELKYEILTWIINNNVNLPRKLQDHKRSYDGIYINMKSNYDIL